MRWVGEAKTVMAMGKVNVARRQGEEISIPDHIDVLCSMVCGAQMHMQFSMVTGLVEGSNQVWIHGTEGTLHIDLGKSTLRMGKKGTKTLEEVGWRGI